MDIRMDMRMENQLNISQSNLVSSNMTSPNQMEVYHGGFSSQTRLTTKEYTQQFRCMVWVILLKG